MCLKNTIETVKWLSTENNILKNIFRKRLLIEKVTDFEKKIEEVTYKINNEIQFESNSIEVRKYIEYSLTKHIDFVKKVICDTTNNTPEVIDRNILVATIFSNNKILLIKFGFNNGGFEIITL